MERRSTLFLLAMFLTSVFVPAYTYAQVQQLWTSPSTIGEKRPLYEINSYLVRYYYVIDTSTHQCRLYNSDNFNLAYTISGIGGYDWIVCRLNDMNANGHPEVLVSGPTTRILDASTSAVIYSWPASYQYYGLATIPGSNTVYAYFHTSSSGSNSLAIYTLGITTSPVDKASNEVLPGQIALEQNYPNPFNPITTIEYSIPTPGAVTVQVFDVTGRLVKTLISESQTAGKHTTQWNGSDESGCRVSSGAYFYVVRDGNTALARKMIVLK